MERLAHLAQAQLFLKVILDVLGELFCPGTRFAGHVDRKVVDQQDEQLIVQSVELGFEVDALLGPDLKRLSQRLAKQVVVVVNLLGRVAADAVVSPGEAGSQLGIVQYKSRQKDLLPLHRPGPVGHQG